MANDTTGDPVTAQSAETTHRRLPDPARAQNRPHTHSQPITASGAPRMS